MDAASLTLFVVLLLVLLMLFATWLCLRMASKLIKKIFRTGRRAQTVVITRSFQRR